MIYCKVCGHKQADCTGGGLESEDQAHDFQPAHNVPDYCDDSRRCHWCGEPLSPNTHTIHWSDDCCDASYYCDDSCRDNHLAQIAAEAIDNTEFLKDILLAHWR